MVLIFFEGELQNTEANIVDIEKKNNQFSQGLVDVLLETAEHSCGQASEVYAYF